ncbi:MAG: S41 family peptidase [Prevotellaceae bacterium]|jgi:carboxyl-terminal processing protease|nr:S41 family peptidase [Prevotellaceae bacterium]
MSTSNKNTIQRVYFILIIILLVMLIGQRYYPGHGRVLVSSGKWDKLNLVLEQIEKNYVDQIDTKEFVERVLPYILEELDPHSVYLPPTDLKRADAALEGSFDGIGIYFNVPNDTAMVSSVVVGGPSERAGVQAGDRIIKIDGEVIAGVKIDQDSIVKRLRGPRGTKVTIDVIRYEVADLVSIPIIRDKIPDKSVDVSYMIDDQIGYIKLSKFTKTSYEEVLRALLDLTDKGMTKLVFDLRSNSGGYMEPALRIAEVFLQKGQLIMYQEGIRRPRQDYYSLKEGFASDVALAVLIDESSASSSEILAGALQDNDRGTIVGRRSFGKGLVQEPIYFSDYSGLRLTVARYYTPTGRCVQRPYEQGYNAYRNDIYERYLHGELTIADSIPKNDSLKYLTPKGKIVYGGGGIIPDVFVPYDTTGVTDFLLQASRKNLMIRFSLQFSDGRRGEIREIKEMSQLLHFFGTVNLGDAFLAFAAGQGVQPKQGEWETSKENIVTQIKAYIGRSTPLDDEAFYSIIGKLDRELQAAISELR